MSKVFENAYWFDMTPIHVNGKTPICLKGLGSSRRVCLHLKHCNGTASVNTLPRMTGGRGKVAGKILGAMEAAGLV